jgi:hypothetical protein
MPSSGQRSATGVGSGVGDGVAVGRSVGLAVGDGEAVGDGLAAAAGGGGEAVAKAMTPPRTMAAAPAAATPWPRRDRMNLVRRDVLGVGGMRRMVVGGGAVYMGQSAHVPV